MIILLRKKLKNISITVQHYWKFSNLYPHQDLKESVSDCFVNRIFSRLLLQVNQEMVESMVTEY